MEVVRHNDKEYNIRSGWHEVPFRDYANAMMFVDEDANYTFCKIIGIDFYEYRALPISIAVHIQNLTEWVGTEPTPNPITSFEFEGETYSALPSLVNITTGQFIDIEKDVRDIGGFDMLPSIICRLFWHKDDVDYSDVLKKKPARMEAFERLPMSVIMGVRDFFIMLSMTSKGNLHLLLNQIQAEAMRDIESCMNDMDGLPLSTRLQITTSLTQLKSKIFPYQRS